MLNADVKPPMLSYFNLIHIFKRDNWRFLGITLTMTVFSSQATDKVSVAFTNIPELLEEQNINAPYTLIFSKLNSIIGDKMRFEYFPSSRASRLFNDKKTDCLFPASADTLRNEQKVPVIASQPINYAIAYVFSLHAFDLNRLITSPRPEYTISYRRGNTFGGNIEKLNQHNSFVVNTDEQSFGMLDNGRVDFVITYLPDATNMILRPNGKQVFYDPQQAFHTQPDSLVCHLTENTSIVIEKVNTAIAELKASGELRKILGGNYIHPN